MREAVWAIVVSVGVAGATLYPAFLGPGRDSFPFSTYPMFSTRRQAPRIPHLVGYTADGERALPPEAVVANGEIMQASVAARLAVHRGPDAVRALCRHTAERVADMSSLAAVQAVAVVTETYDPVGYFVEGPRPIQSQRHLVCRVPR